jgi:prolyl 4-hydroxylase
MRRVQRQDCAEAEGRVYWFDNFIEAPRCEGILAELEFAFWRPSTVYLEGEGGKHQYVYSRRRVSSTTSERWFTPPLRRAIALIDRRISRHLPQAPSCREEWQATIYERGGRFDYHHDSGYFGDDAAGERTHSVVLYLEAPERGGETRFPLLDLSVKSLILLRHKRR